MIVETLNSKYEIDTDGKKVRRLTGQNQPTQRQGQDGDWRTFEEVLEPTVGNSLLIIWKVDSENNGDSILRTTMTSTIVKIINDKLN